MPPFGPGGPGRDVLPSSPLAPGLPGRPRSPSEPEHIRGILHYSVSIHPHSSAHQGAPAHDVLHCQVGLAPGHSLDGDWRRRPGRPRAHWIDQLRNDTGSVHANLWRQAILWGHGGATRHPELATR